MPHQWKVRLARAGHQPTDARDHRRGGEARPRSEVRQGCAVLSRYIRFFAQTDGGATSSAALEYLRSIVRIAPVRLVSLTGPLTPAWNVYERLLTTQIDESAAPASAHYARPMPNLIASIVCADPHHWIRKLKI